MDGVCLLSESLTLQRDHHETTNRQRIKPGGFLVKRDECEVDKWTCDGRHTSCMDSMRIPGRIDCG